MRPDMDPAFTEVEFRAWQRRRLPPDNEVSIVVGLNQFVVDTGDLFVWLSAALCRYNDPGLPRSWLGTSGPSRHDRRCDVIGGESGTR